ncbi:sugar kinase [Thermogemmatispora aurantia]|jgi:predicted NBD/HSP70 family sugar kinase|uniref:ROK family protein n=2 Tax=Thermogemmatispora TaxID=768669 RepID=UPI00124F2334|nr:ROK family protein [Thermogemmatispora aurantia]GER84522.1 sugar kinase [Thermogemmatispora aurantia]
MKSPLEGNDASRSGAVLALFRTGQARTRADVIRLTGLARSTVTQRLEQLLAAGLLVPDGASASTGGRPPTQFKFNAARGVFLTADVGASHLRCALTDLAGAILAEEASELDVAAGPHPVLEQVTRTFLALLQQQQVAPQKVHGIGISVPGPVEFATGRVVSPPIMTGWDGFDIPGYFLERFACPTLVDNDVNVMAFGEYKACWPEHPHMLMVKVGTGVGCGIISNGQILRGAQGAAGDLGHIPYSGDLANLTTPPLCRCGNRGCVEAYAGGWALLRDLRALGHQVHSTYEVVRLIRAGQQDAVHLARQAARVLGQAISDAVSLLNPSLVVLGGRLAHADEPLLAGIREVVYRRSLPLATRDLQITTSRLDIHAGITGLALLLGEYLYAPELVDLALDPEVPTPPEGRFGPLSGKALGYTLRLLSQGAATP